MKGSIFGVKPIPALWGPGGGLVVAPAEKASLLGSRFDIKQRREQFVTSLSCFPLLRCNSLALFDLLCSCVCFLILTYGGVDLLGMFLLFQKKIADNIFPKRSVFFRRLIRLGSFPECLGSANVTAITKGAPSPDRENYRPISITPIL